MGIHNLESQTQTVERWCHCGRIPSQTYYSLICDTCVNSKSLSTANQPTLQTYFDNVLILYFVHFENCSACITWKLSIENSQSPQSD